MNASRRTQLALALCLVVGPSACADPEPTVVTSTVTVVETTTPARVPNLDCQAPVIRSFDVRWERRFGPGIPPPRQGASGPKPAGFFEVYTSNEAVVELLNVSRHRIYTRGIYYHARWHDEAGDLQMPWGRRSGQPGYVPEDPGILTGRTAEYVESGDSIRFDRTYSNLRWDSPLNADGITARTSSGPPATWIQSVDWWFAEPNVREQCGQMSESGRGDRPTNVPETTTGQPQG